MHAHQLAALATMLVALTPTSISRGEPRGAADHATKRLPTIVPWLEVNVPRSPLGRYYPEPARTRPGARLIDFCVEGLVEWAKITNIAIITTKPGQVDHLYPELMRRKPESMFIIGGLKTYTLPGASSGDTRPYDFADAAGWRDIAAEALRISGITGTNVIVFENETALTPYHAGKATIDLARLRAALEPLRDTGLETWWNLPTILADSSKFPNRRRETARLVATIAEVLPNARFMAGSTMWPGWQKNAHTEVDRRRQLRSVLTTARMVERLIVAADGQWNYADGRRKRCYLPKEAVEMMPQLTGDTINVYPETVGWIEVARQLEALFAETPKAVP